MGAGVGWNTSLGRALLAFGGHLGVFLWGLMGFGHLNMEIALFSISLELQGKAKRLVQSP